MPKYIATETAFVTVNARFRKKRSGSIGAGVRVSHQHERDEQDHPTMIEPEHLGRAPAEGVRADDAPDEAEEPEAGEHEADEVELVVRSRVSRGASTRAGS